MELEIPCQILTDSPCYDFGCSMRFEIWMVGNRATNEAFIYTTAVYNIFHKEEATDNLICNAKKIDYMEAGKNRLYPHFSLNNLQKNLEVLENKTIRKSKKKKKIKTNGI